MFQNYYITTCGRIFNKKSHKRSLGSFGVIPSTMHTFTRFITRNKLNKEDFVISETGLFDKNKTKLFLFKYKEYAMPYTELKGAVDSNGYVVFSFENHKTMKWHRAVMMALKPIDNPDLYQINHIDGNKANNCVLNLEWCDAKHNIRHAWDSGLAKRTEELNNKAKNTITSKTSLEHVMDENYKGQKPNLIKFLKSRGLKFEDYEYVVTSRTNSGHALGYIKEK